MKPVLNRCQIFLAVTLAMLLGVIATAKCRTEAGIIHIKFSDVPITTAIDNLARMANLNYFIDPKLFAPPGGSNPNGITEPKLTIDWTNMTAQNSLAAILKEHGLVMVQDKFTTVTLITGTNHIANVMDTSLLDGNTNTKVLISSTVINRVSNSKVLGSCKVNKSFGVRIRRSQSINTEIH